MLRLDVPSREVVRLQEQRAITPRRRVDRGAQAGRTAADDQKVPGLAGTDPLERLCPPQAYSSGQLARSDMLMVASPRRSPREATG